MSLAWGHLCAGSPTKKISSSADHATGPTPMTKQKVTHADNGFGSEARARPAVADSHMLQDMHDTCTCSNKLPSPGCHKICAPRRTSNLYTNSRALRAPFAKLADPAWSPYYMPNYWKLYALPGTGPIASSRALRTPPDLHLKQHPDFVRPMGFRGLNIKSRYQSTRHVRRGAEWNMPGKIAHSSEKHANIIKLLKIHISFARSHVKLSWQAEDDARGPEFASLLAWMCVRIYQSIDRLPQDMSDMQARMSECVSISFNFISKHISEFR